MASTFRRRKAPSGVSSAATGVLGPTGAKPWTGGVFLTSTGLRDLDHLLAGGQPLGTCIWLEEDRWTQHLSESLVKYWCAEGLSQGQQLLIPVGEDETSSTDLSNLSSWFSSEYEEQRRKEKYRSVSRKQIESLIESLPRNLHVDKHTASKTQASPGNTPLDSLRESIQEEEEEVDPEQDGTVDAGLKIAWQYRTSVQRERLGNVGSKTSEKSSTGNIFCHSYDLQGTIQESIRADKKIHVPILSSLLQNSGVPYQSRQRGFSYFQQVIAEVESVLSNDPKGTVRVLLYHPPIRILQTALPLLLGRIRSERLPVVVLISIQAWRILDEQRALRNATRRTCDVVLTTEGFAGRAEYPPPMEFRTFQGLLHVIKTSVHTGASGNGGGHFADATTSKRPDANLYGLRRDRRKLHIELLHIPPEDYSGAGGSVSSGVRSGAGRTGKSESNVERKGTGCGSSGAKLVDF